MKRGTKPRAEVCMLNLPLPYYLEHRERILTHQIDAIKGQVRRAENELETTRQALAALTSAKRT